MSDIIIGSPEEMLRADQARFFVKDPKDFSPARNKQIIEATITAYEKQREKKGKEHDDAYGERSDAVVSYLKSLDQGKTNQSVESYFGRQYLAHLRGEAIRQKLMQGLMFKNQQGDIIKPNA